VVKEILKYLRQKKKYSQDEVSKILNITRQSYIKYESGEVEPSVESVRKLSALYKVPYSTLIDNDVPLPEKKSAKYEFANHKPLVIASPKTFYNTTIVCTEDFSRALPVEGEIYSHFKREFSDTITNPNIYLYKIITIAENTETNEMMCVYQALYSPFKTFVRPLEMFMSEVDVEKYSECKQKYRFEKVTDFN